MWLVLSLPTRVYRIHRRIVIPSHLSRCRAKAPASLLRKVMLLYVIPSGNTILNENTSLLENQRATWKKDRVPSEISASEPRKDRALTKQHCGLRGHKMLFRPLYQEFHYLLLPLSHSPLAIIFLGEPTSGDVGRHLLSGVMSPTMCDGLMAMLAVDIHTSYVNMPTPLLTFSTMFLSTRKYVASRVCRLHLRWHYIYI